MVSHPCLNRIEKSILKIHKNHRDIDQPKKRHCKFIMTICDSNCDFGDASRFNFKVNDMKTSNKSRIRLLQSVIDRINHHSRYMVIVCDNDLG